MAKILMQFLKQSQMPLCFSEESGKHIFNFLMQSDPGVMRASLMGDIVRGLKGIPKFINDNRD